MKNIYLLFLFYKLYFLLFVKAIYIPYGRLECDILKTIYQVDNYNNFYNNFLKWKKGEDKSNDENDVYINIINKLYKECLVERPLKNIKYERNIKEIFEKGIERKGTE
ncbi:hypothetical protein BCR36DRAFT_151716 [Piromyces finnis]|uniref:Uncharacterized protein n=1 Tax=Piromyces finnis TaxID=1754191 RepID=A0A1Y1VI85_9FUNG|nr:hypothetical protein BCR36DRAFT_151716 [Piromyces finnis]|eukprot:ORX57116.1 hypothetical protein BCR36DRAFT_151716 [Piromyces finnis]